MTLTGHPEGKKRLRVTYLICLGKWIVEQGLGRILRRNILLGAARNRKLPKDNNRKYGTEIQRRIITAKDAFQKMKTLLRDRKMASETKK